MTTLFGFNVLEECDPISIECILKDNNWKPVWIATYDYWQMLDAEKERHESLLIDWLKTVPATPPVVSKVGGPDNGKTGIIEQRTILKIWLQPEDYVLYVLKFQ